MPNDMDMTDKRKEALVRCNEKIAFIEGALGLETSLSYSLSEGAVSLNFPSEKAACGWFDDNVEFETVFGCLEFLENVALMIRISRLQRRGE